MSDSLLKLARPPIIEAVLDIDCDMPPGQDIAKLEAPAFEVFREQYPQLRTQFIQEHEFVTKSDAPPKLAITRGIRGYHFLHQDEKQLVQVRGQGFSFNRLTPYTGLDDYLPEIERTWNLFVKIASPVQIKVVRLRYINRILLPTPPPSHKVELTEYLEIGPRLPDEQRLTFVGFLNQHVAVEAETGNQVNIILTSQRSEEGKLPILFDICVASSESRDPQDWTWLSSKIQSLRVLKNHIFRNTLTEKCLNLFQL